MKYLPHLFAALGLCAAALQAGAQTTTSTASAVTVSGYRYTHIARFLEEARYESSGVVIYPRQAFPSKIYDVRPHQALQKMFPASVTGDGNNQATSNALWASLLQSGAALGGASSGVRARDLSGNFIVNVSWAANPGKNHYFAFYEDNIPAGRYANFAPTLLSGPNKGATVVGNAQLLAVGDARTLWLDADGSLSQAYLSSGHIATDHKATQFNGGASGWADTTLRSHLGQFIGHEQGQLYFLEGSSTLHVYDMALKFIRTDEIRLSGELRSHTLGDIVDGKVKGATYIGWDLGPVIGFFPR
jgi:hypothetical protein